MCRIVFTSRKKTIKNGEIVQKKFVLSEDTFVFGPLLCGKTRERWGESKLHKYHVACRQTDVRCSGPTFCFFSAGIVRVATLRTQRR